MRQQLLAYPYIKELAYRSKIDPYELSLILRSIEESVLRSILRGSESVETLNDLKLGVETSYNALSTQAGLLFNYSNIPAGESGCLFATSFDVVEGTARKDPIAGITTLNWDPNRNYTKVPRYDSDADGISDQVAPSVQVLVDGTYRSSENKVYNSLNRSNKSFWIEEVSTTDHEIEIRLPPSINKNFNYIEVVPFPVFGVQISGITYQDSLSVDQVLYDENDPTYSFYNSSGPLVLHLSPKETNGTFKFFVRATHGVIGFSNIDVAMIDYKDEEQTALFKIANLPFETTTDYMINTVDLDFYVNGFNTYSEFIKEVAIVSGDNKITLSTINQGVNQLGQSITVEAGDSMYLSVIMKEHNTTSPVFRGCKLTYEVTT